MELSKRVAEKSALEARVALQSDYIQQLEACVGQVSFHGMTHAPAVCILQRRVSMTSMCGRLHLQKIFWLRHRLSHGAPLGIVVTAAGWLNYPRFLCAVRGQPRQ